MKHDCLNIFMWIVTILFWWNGSKCSRKMKLNRTTQQRNTPHGRVRKIRTLNKESRREFFAVVWLFLFVEEAFELLRGYGNDQRSTAIADELITSESSCRIINLSAIWTAVIYRFHPQCTAIMSILTTLYINTASVISEYVFTHHPIIDHLKTLFTFQRSQQFPLLWIHLPPQSWQFRLILSKQRADKVIWIVQIEILILESFSFHALICSSTVLFLTHFIILQFVETSGISTE